MLWQVQSVILGLNCWSLCWPCGGVLDKRDLKLYAEVSKHLQLVMTIIGLRLIEAHCDQCCSFCYFRQVETVLKTKLHRNDS